MVVTTAGTVDGRQLDWLLVDFVRSTVGTRHALVVSADGLRLAASQAVGEALGDQLAAVTSGMLSLAQSIASSFGAGPVRQTIVEMSGGYLFLTSISEGSTLAVLAERSCDMGMIGYEMTLLANRVGHMLTPARRPAPGPGGQPRIAGHERRRRVRPVVRPAPERRGRLLGPQQLRPARERHDLRQCHPGHGQRDRRRRRHRCGLVRHVRSARRGRGAVLGAERTWGAR